MTTAVDQPQPTPPIAGMPSLGEPVMNSQLSRIFKGRALKLMHIAGVVHDIPSARQRNEV